MISWRRKLSFRQGWLDKLLEEKKTKDLYHENKRLEDVVKHCKLFINKEKVNQWPAVKLPNIRNVEIRLNKENDVFDTFFRWCCPDSLNLLYVINDTENQNEYQKISFYFETLRKWIEN